MLKELLDVKKANAPMFQVVLLKNDASQEVEVHETEEVDFFRIQEHLKQGGSVFITSKRSQKLDMPKLKSRTPRIEKGTRKVTAFYFDHL
jgi:hypothetical protein